MRKDTNFHKDDWEFLFGFSMADAQIYPNNKRSSVLAMEVEIVTAIDPIFWKWADQHLDDTFGTSPDRYPATNRGSTSQMENLF